MPQTKNKILVPVVSVVLHDVPEDGPIADVDHGLGNILRVANTQAHSSAKQDYFHLDSLLETIKRVRAKQQFPPTMSHLGNDGIARRATGLRGGWEEERRHDR